MAEARNSIVPKRHLGRALHELRKAAGMSREDVSALLACSVSKVSRMENGLVGVPAAQLRVLVEAFGVEPKRQVELERLARDARKRRRRTTYSKALPGWFRRYRDLEETASERRCYAADLVPGLLQTEDYVRALVVAGSRDGATGVESLVQARLARQRRLVAEDPIRLWAIIGEAALRTRVGGCDVLRGQLDHLLAMVELPNVTIQVMPFAAGAHAATGFNFVLLNFADAVGVDVVYVENLTSASYLDKPGDPNRQHYVRVWEQVVAAALSPTRSMKMIGTCRRDLPR
ncbi:helix-turn-helix domain-containing protein [Actinokineospora sp. NPDC004072]